MMPFESEKKHTNKTAESQKPHTAHAETKNTCPKSSQVEIAHLSFKTLLQ